MLKTIENIRQTRWLPFEKTDPLPKKCGKTASLVCLGVLDLVFEWSLFQDIASGLSERRLRNMANAQLAEAQQKGGKAGE